MATVAAASSGHGLAVLTNACIKQPVKSKVKHGQTDFSRSELNRGGFIGARTVSFGDVLGEDVADSSIAMSRWLADFDSSPAKEDIDKDLGELSNDEFYRRLMELKNEHKKTLQMCEKLYRQKLATGVNQSLDFDRCEAEATDSNGVVNGHVSDSAHLAHSQEYGFEDAIPQDRIKDLSTKPPISRHTIADNKYSKSFQAVSRRPLSGLAFRDNLSRSFDEDDWRKMKQRTRAAQATWAFRDNRSLSFDEDDWRKMKPQNRSAREMQANISQNFLETQSEIYDPRESAAAMARIEDMWEQFSVEEYAPKGHNSRRPSSAQSEGSRNKKNKAEKEWRHRITIPQPFKMTLRESNRDRQKSKSQLLHEQEILQKQQEEEAECEKKFKATPVPANVYLPLFEEYNEKNEARRRYVTHYRKELLKSIEKPFKFMHREEEKKRSKLLNSKIYSREEKADSANQFKAKPVPDFLYDNLGAEKALEEQEYRKIRIKMRAEELMKSASLPPNMEARKKLKEQKIREQKTRRKSGKKKFVPRINTEVPNYDELYRQFHKEMQKRKMQREATVTEPFQLRTAKIPSKKEKILKDMEKDNELLTENRWPFRNPRTTPRKSFVSSANLTSSVDSIPHRTCSSAEMRFSKGRERATSFTQQELDEIEYHKRQKLKEMKLRREILERTLANEQDRQQRPSPEEKLKEYRESDRARMAEYRKSLEDMKQRVNQRPLLFEQVKQENAKKAAENRYAKALREHGLDETYIQQKSSLSTGVDTDADDYDMDETSYRGLDTGPEDSDRQTVEDSAEQ